MIQFKTLKLRIKANYLDFPGRWIESILVGFLFKIENSTTLSGDDKNTNLIRKVFTLMYWGLYLLYLANSETSCSEVSNRQIVNFNY